MGDAEMTRLGVRLREEWAGGGSGNEPLLSRLLDADLARCSSGTLPVAAGAPAVEAVLGGRHFVQIDDAVDVAASLNAAAEAELAKAEGEAGVGSRRGPRCLKLVLSDGVTTIVGIEQEPLGRLVGYELKRGLKMTLIGPIRMLHGVLLLTPDTVDVHGGAIVDDAAPAAAIEFDSEVLAGLDELDGDWDTSQASHLSPEDGGGGNKRGVDEQAAARDVRARTDATAAAPAAVAPSAAAPSAAAPSASLADADFSDFSDDDWMS